MKSNSTNNMSDIIKAKAAVDSADKALHDAKSTLAEAERECKRLVKAKADIHTQLLASTKKCEAEVGVFMAEGALHRAIEEYRREASVVRVTKKEVR